MAHKKSPVRPLGGMDSDSEDRSVDAKNYRYALNFRNGLPYVRKGGTGTNLKGNLQVTDVAYSYTGQVPSGINKTIGSFEDKVGGTVIFFVYNSDALHCIYRYYLSTGQIRQIYSYPWEWTAATKITSINLQGNQLYWTDGSSKMLDIEKSDVRNKLKTWKVYFPITNQFTTNTPIYLQYSNSAGYLINTDYIVPPFTSNEDALTYLANRFNTDWSQYITVETCGGCSLTITEVNNEENGRIAMSGYLPLVVPENHYGFLLLAQYTDLCKWPALFEPTGTFSVDTNVPYNYVKNAAWQFRQQNDYIVSQESALSPYSQIPTNNLSYGVTPQENMNYVDVLLNDPSLIDAQVMVILKQVSVYYRNGNTGTEKKAVILDPCDYYDVDADGNAIAHYKFYNNELSQVANPETVAKQFDAIPITNASQTTVNNHLVLGGCTTGLDAPDCIQATSEIRYTESGLALHKVTGYIRVNSPLVVSNNPIGRFPTNASCVGAILWDVTNQDYPFFGGITKALNPTVNVDFGIRSGMEDNFQQVLPEAGWAVYAAGTEFMAISKQLNAGYMPTLSNGAVDSSSQDQMEIFWAQYGAGSPLYRTDIYSTFELWLPDGEYVLRLPSHWCSFGDKLGKGAMYDLNNGTSYQRTSTYTQAYIDTSGGFHADKEIRVTVNGADVTTGTFVVEDLATLWDTTVTTIHADGYVLDAGGTTNPDDLKNDGVTVENCTVTSGSTVGLPPPSPTTKFTDHNGFFYAYTLHTVGDTTPWNIWISLGVLGSLANYGQLSASILLGNLSDLYFGALTTGTMDSGDVLYSVIIPAGRVEFTLAASTRISGQITDANGIGLPSVPVVYTHGKVAMSDTNGNYNIIAYPDQESVSRATDILIIGNIPFVTATYPFGLQLVAINITLFGANTGTNPPPYSNTAIYEVPDFAITILSSAFNKEQKRGGRVTYGLRYYDEQGRQTTVKEAMSVYIPFFTENGVQGFPIVTWTLPSTFLPPVWAATYQWMRTKDEIYGTYLQWVANEVMYVIQTNEEGSTETEIPTTYNNFNATHIKISLANISFFYQQNNASVVEYTYQDGDRLRLISKRDGTLYSGGILELEVVNFEVAGQWAVIKYSDIVGEALTSGIMFEIYRPAKLTEDEEKVYYECGETYACTTPNVVGNAHSVLTADFTNASDYYRGRIIPVRDDTNNFSSNLPYFIESQYISDYWDSRSQDIGRNGRYNPNDVQRYRPTLMLVSGNFISGTQINELASFAGLNQKELDNSYGTIQRLCVVGEVLIVVCENKTVASYVGKVVLAQAQRVDGVNAITDGFLGTQRPLAGELGTQHPESVYSWGNYLYGFDARRSTPWRYANDGQNDISESAEVHMKTDFLALCEEGVYSAIGAVDTYYKEYKITITKKKIIAATYVAARTQYTFSWGRNEVEVAVGDLVYIDVYDATTNLTTNVAFTVASIDGNYVTLSTTETVSFSDGQTVDIQTAGEAVTLVWCEPKNQWTDYRSYTPESMCPIRNNFVSFKDGELWLHDANPIRNNFYGVQYTTKLHTVHNAEPEWPKMWFTLQLEQFETDATGTTYTNNWSAPIIRNNNNQVTVIDAVDFTQIEEMWYAPMSKDANTIGVTSPTVNGRMMRSSSLEIQLQNNSTNEVTLRAIIAGYEPSFTING